MHWVQWAYASDLVSTHGARVLQDHTLVWEETGPMAWLRDKVGLPWWVLAWGIAAAYPFAIALLVLVFEAVMRVMRLDPARHAAFALGWSLSGWRAFLAWIPLFAVPSVSPYVGMFGFEALPGWTPTIGLFVLPFVAGLVLRFFAWNPAYVMAPRPTARTRFRWPGTAPVLVFLAAWILAWILVAASDRALGPAELPIWVLAGLAALVLPFLLYIGICLQLFWFNASSLGHGPAIVHAVRESRRWRVFGAMLALVLRTYALLAAVLLPLLPAFLFLTAILGSLETQFLSVALEPDAVQPMIDASRWFVSWWWVLGLAGWAVMDGAVLPWVEAVASGRLLHELGLIAPPADPAHAIAPEPERAV